MVLVDGKQATQIDAHDRGLHYGDGVFRTLKVENGMPCWWADQYRKLAADCEALNLACPEEALLLNEVRQAAREPDTGGVKIILTRGLGKRGYALPEQCQPVRLVMGFAYAAAARRDIRLRWCELRLSFQPRLAGIKHLNRLENVLARSEWNNPAIDEGLLLDETGNVIGGTMTNLFLFEQGRLVTPELARCGIAGVTRERLMRGASRNGMAVSIENIMPARLLAADEVFLVNSLIRIWRADSLDKHRWADTGMLANLVNWLNEEN